MSERHKVILGRSLLRSFGRVCVDMSRFNPDRRKSQQPTIRRLDKVIEKPNRYMYDPISRFPCNSGLIPRWRDTSHTFP